MHQVFGEILEDFVERVCNTLTSIEERGAVEQLGQPATELFVDSMTGKRREAAARQLLRPLNIKVSHRSLNLNY
jgi:hypothetical protein